MLSLQLHVCYADASFGRGRANAGRQQLSGPKVRRIDSRVSRFLSEFSLFEIRKCMHKQKKKKETLGYRDTKVRVVIVGKDERRKGSVVGYLSHFSTKSNHTDLEQASESVSVIAKNYKKKKKYRTTFIFLCFFFLLFFFTQNQHHG